MKKFIFWIRKHLVISALIVALIGGGVWWYRSKNTAAAPPQYLTAAVERGTLSTSISGSGQVSASSQIDLKPEVSGKVISVSVHNGDAVTQGQLNIYTTYLTKMV
jgi:HlyD family secretion protein